MMMVMTSGIELYDIWLEEGRLHIALPLLSACLFLAMFTLHFLS